LKGWAVVALDIGVDTTTPNGELIANVMATFAQFERRLIGQRTKDALAVKRQEGVQLGRPRVLGVRTLRRIDRLRSKGFSYREIADALNASGTATAHGGKQWYPATVRKIALR
jgi:DNA invertase Pin-like site-specific DNA recombinase